MKIHLDDRRFGKSLVWHFRVRDYLAVERAPGIVEVLPITSRDEEAARERTLSDLRRWASANPAVSAIPLEDDLQEDLGG
jgi:hypothetical protein